MAKITAIEIGLIASLIAVAGAAMLKSLPDWSGQNKAVERVRQSTMALNNYKSICEAAPDAKDYSDNGLSIAGIYCGRGRAIMTVAVQDKDKLRPVYIIAEPGRPVRTPPIITADLPTAAYGL